MSTRPWVFAAGAIAAALPITIYTIVGVHTGAAQWSRPLYQVLILLGLLLAAPSVTVFTGGIGRRWQRTVLLLLTLVLVWFALQLYGLVLYVLLTGDGP